MAFLFLKFSTKFRLLECNSIDFKQPLFTRHILGWYVKCHLANQEMQVLTLI